jgi:DNA polymerase-3 subunit gamma/tau
MPYRVMALRWRPQSFDEVIGQDHVTKTLQNAISSERIGHAYLFSGPRGVGKTTVARILAKALNCQEGPTPTPCNKCTLCQEITEDRSMDVLEIDGASNTHLEDIKKILESVKYAPTHARYKVYIIDEVHMISKHAFNALLKTLEEPPSHVVFIFATTEPRKIPLTILSRCQRFDFRRISSKQIVDRLAHIAGQEKIQVDDGALALIAKKAEGSMRDSQSLLDQVLSSGDQKITEKLISEVLGLVTRDLFFQFTDSVRAGNSKKALDLVATVEEQGWDLEDFADGLLDHLRHLLLVKIDPQTPELVGLSQDDQKRYKEQGAGIEEEDLLRMTVLVSDTIYDLKYSSRPRFLLEMLAVKLAKMETTVQLKELVQDLNRVLGKEVRTDSPPEIHQQPIAQEPPSAKPAPPPPEPTAESGDLWNQMLSQVNKKKCLPF